MSTDDVLRDLVAPLLQVIEPALQGVVQSTPAPDALRDAMAWALEGGGKRIRPCLTLASCQAAGGDPRQALPQALALELIHTYSLVHDDLPELDNDDVRRGRPAVHARFGHDMGLLAGDGLLTLAFEVLARDAESPAMAARRIRSVQVLARCAGVSGMVGGQVLDIRRVTDTPDAMRAMHAGKTGALFVAAAHMGAIAAGASQSLEDRLRTFGEVIGRAFQVGDDLEDFAAMDARGGDHEALVNWAARWGVDSALAQVEEAVAQAHRALDHLPGDATLLRALADWNLTRARAAAQALRPPA
jgi:geranylgeranyl pyrophosphate synthase